MFLKNISFTIVLTLMTFSHTALAQDKIPTGLWLTGNERSAIEIRPCQDNEQELCGRIAWIIEDGMQFDTENPDKALRDRPICGLQILKNFEQSSKSPDKWEDGKIYKADDGDTYHANLKVLEQDKLRVHGYVGIPLFGKTQIWTRVSQEDYPQCVKPDKN